MISIEALLIAIRRLPSLSAIVPLQTLAQELYMLDRHMIQFEPAAARWDPRLGYTLRPGEFFFVNTEFRTRYSVNQLGLLDDEESLDGPEIVVIGDSYAMGWGVEQDESFPQVLEVLSGRKVLNSAVASWGTARQLRRLEDVNLNRATHLVIQFCNNDYFENLALSQEGLDFAVHTKTGYSTAVGRYQRNRRYYPGPLYGHSFQLPPRPVRRQTDPPGP